MKKPDTAQQLDVNETGARLDRFVAEHLPELSRAHVQRLIDDAQILVDDAARKASYRVQAGEKISVTIPPPEPTTLVAEKIPLAILFENRDLIVINKSPGLVVHPAAGHASHTLVNAILAHMQTSPLRPSPIRGGVGGEVRPGIVHRLDKDTSGVIIVAKNDLAMRDLQAQFKDRTVKKTYLALVQGQVQPPHGIIDAPIGRDPKHRERMQVMTHGTRREAVTVYHTLATLGDYTFVQAEPQTGRTHQIRVHLAFLGFPVVADEMYGRAKNALGLSRQFLHAWKISFELPRTHKRVDYIAPLPGDLREVLDKLGHKDLMT